MRDGFGCLCGEWRWRDEIAPVGLVALARHCPRCGRRILLVFRGPVYVGAAELEGSHGEAFEAALVKLGMGREEIRMLHEAVSCLLGAA